MNSLKIILAFAFISMTTCGFSQLMTKGNTNEYTVEANKIAKPGSYEIMPRKFEEAFTAEAWNNILIQIELKRDEYEEVFWQATAYTRIRIIPRSELTE